MGCCAGVRLCAPAAERPRRASARDALGPFSFEGQEGLVVSKGSRAEGAEFPCSEEEALCGVGTVCNCTELCVSCFLLGWHLICSGDRVLVTSSIEAFAVVVSREACITY